MCYKLFFCFSVVIGSAIDISCYGVPNRSVFAYAFLQNKKMTKTVVDLPKMVLPTTDDASPMPYVSDIRFRENFFIVSQSQLLGNPACWYADKPIPESDEIVGQQSCFSLQDGGFIGVFNNGYHYSLPKIGYYIVDEKFRNACLQAMEDEEKQKINFCMYAINWSYTKILFASLDGSKVYLFCLLE